MGSSGAGFAPAVGSVDYVPFPAQSAVPVIYVGTGATASDAHSGLSTGNPKSTIAGALAALAGAPGVVQLLYGTFGGIAAEIVIPSNTTLKGLDSALTTIQAQQVTWTAQTGLLGLTDASNVLIQDLTIDGNWDGNTGAPKGAINGLYTRTNAAATLNNRLSNVIVKNASKIGVTAHGDTNGIFASELYATNVQCANNGNTGFVASFLTLLEIQGGHYNDNGTAYAPTTSFPGIGLSGCQSVIVNGAVITGNGSHGITTQTPGSGATTLAAPIVAGDTAITLTTAINTTNNDTILLIGTEQMLVTAGAGTANLTVVRGYNETTAASAASGAAVTAYFSAPMERLVLTNNVVSFNGVSHITQGHGIVVSVAARYFTTTGNICVGNWLNGIDIDVAAGLVTGLKGVVIPTYGVVSGNVCTGATQGSGIHLNYAAFGVMTGNICANNKKGTSSDVNDGCGISAQSCYGWNYGPNTLTGNDNYGMSLSPGQVQLGAAVTTTGQTAFVLAGTSGTTPLRANRSVLKIGAEQVLVTAIAGTTLTVQRGYNATVAATYPNSTYLKYFSGCMILNNVEVVDGNNVVAAQLVASNGVANYNFDAIVAGNSYVLGGAIAPT